MFIRLHATYRLDRCGILAVQLPEPKRSAQCYQIVEHFCQQMASSILYLYLEERTGILSSYIGGRLKVICIVDRFLFFCAAALTFLVGSFLSEFGSQSNYY